MNRADQERIRAAVEEALCPLTGVTVLSVEPVPGASGLEVPGGTGSGRRK